MFVINSTSSFSLKQGIFDDDVRDDDLIGNDGKVEDFGENIVIITSNDFSSSFEADFSPTKYY